MSPDPPNLYRKSRKVSASDIEHDFGTTYKYLGVNMDDMTAAMKVLKKFEEDHLE